MVRDLIIHLPAPRSSRRGTLWARLFWAIMLAGHLPTLLALQTRLYEAPVEPTGLIRFGFITLSVVYFSLKLFGFRFWRSKSSWDRVVIYCLVVLLLHSGAVIDANPPLGQPGLIWVQLVSPFLLALSGVSLLAMFYQTTRPLGLWVLIPLEQPRFSRDSTDPPPSCVRSLLLSSSIQRRGPPSSFFQ